MAETAINIAAKLNEMNKDKIKLEGNITKLKQKFETEKNNFEALQKTMKTEFEALQKIRQAAAVTAEPGNKSQLPAGC